MDDKTPKYENGGDERTRYQISSMVKEEQSKWVRISFDALDDTTLPQNSRKRKKTVQQPPTSQKILSKQEVKEDGSTVQVIPESVLQYERQLRKIRAADRASKTNINIQDHLHTIYSDGHVVVANKPSGILCVPGVNKNRSLLDLVFEVYGSAKMTTTPFPRDSMIVHRLDMDTSGIVIFARTRLAMSKLHQSFRERTGTKKIYEALLVGWLDVNKWIEFANVKGGFGGDMHEVEESEGKNQPSVDIISSGNVESLGGGEVHLPLQRDHRHPPFMRVSTPESEAEAHRAVKDLNHAGYKKLVAKKPKPSTTQFRILSHEKWFGHPVTRVELIPITGRTHQLRAHCAALGHPILGDSAYGFCGEAHPNGGFSDEVISEISPTCASFELRRDAEDTVRENGRVMCLHARELTIDHPVTGDQVSFEAAPSF